MAPRPRVLLIGPELILGWTESTARALESLGCTVTTVYYNRSRIRGRIEGLRRFVGRRFGCRMPATPHWLLERYLLWSNKRKAEAMIRAACAFRPDLVLILKGESLTAATLQELKHATGAMLAVWWVDHPLMNAESGHLWREVPRSIPLFDGCFVFDHAYEPLLREAGARMVRFLPCAADPDIFKPQTLTPMDRATYGAAVSLVGIYSERRGRVLSALCQESGLGVWGPGWSQFFAKQASDSGNPFRGETLLPGEACKVYNASSVNLNTHLKQTQRAGLNTRTFEILASGTFELCDYVSEMDALLESGCELAVYRSPEEAADLARYYIKAEDERRRIAEAGHKRVLAEHTYRHRMQTVLSTLSL